MDLNASGRSPRSLTLEYFKEKGYEKIPAYGPFRFLFRVVWMAGLNCMNDSGSMDMDQILEAGHHLCQGRISGDRTDRLLLGRECQIPEPLPQC